MTDGMKTSEFYMSVIVGIIGIALAVGLIGPDQADVASEWAGGVVESIGALVAALAVGGYSISRGMAKKG